MSASCKMWSYICDAALLTYWNNALGQSGLVSILVLGFNHHMGKKGSAPVSLFINSRCQAKFFAILLL